MRLMRLMGRMGFIGLVGLMGCSKDAVEELGGAEGEGMPVEVKGYVADFDENQLVTRSWTPASPYQLYGESDKSIGIAFTQNGKGPLKGHFFKSSGKWRTNIKDGDIKAETYYYLYGYVPHLSGMKFEITDRVGANTNYSAGAKISLTDVPAIMPSDLCVTIGAKHGSNAETPAGLRAGDFAYKGGSTTTENYVFLLFEHLYASLRVQMRVHGDYNALRTIKLKSLRLKTQAGETTSNTKTNIVIDLKANDVAENPIQSIAYTPAGETISEAPTFWSSTAGEQLTTDYTEHSAHFMPLNITTFVLTSVYDVYDKQGNLLRKDCMVTNTMQLSDLLTGQETTRRGSRYTIKMTIKPTYLYMLSEPDLDSPTVTVE